MYKNYKIKFNIEQEWTTDQKDDIYTKNVLPLFAYGNWAIQKQKKKLKLNLKFNYAGLPVRKMLIKMKIIYIIILRFT